jgi:hypothetical protein
VHQLLGLQPIGHELGNRDEGESVLLGDLVQLIPPGHRSVWVEDLADHARGIEPSQPGEVDTGLSLPHPL